MKIPIWFLWAEAIAFWLNLGGRSKLSKHNDLCQSSSVTISPLFSSISLQSLEMWTQGSVGNDSIASHRWSSPQLIEISGCEKSRDCESMNPPAGKQSLPQLLDRSYSLGWSKRKSNKEQEGVKKKREKRERERKREKEVNAFPLLPCWKSA